MDEFDYIAGSMEEELKFTQEVKLACKIGRVWYNGMKESGWDEMNAQAIGLNAIMRAAGWTIPMDYGGEIKDE